MLTVLNTLNTYLKKRYKIGQTETKMNEKRKREVCEMERTWRLRKYGKYVKKQRETTDHWGSKNKWFEEYEKEMEKLKNGLKKINFEWMKTSKANMQPITSEGKNDLTKQNCKIKNG